METKLFSSALGTPLAAGSNSELFWLITQRPSPTIFYANHNEFEGQQGPRHVLPISPLWLREAIGIIELDPSGRHEPPLVRPDGKLQVVTYVASPRGDYKRVLIMSATTGTIEQTTLYDQSGKLIASATLKDHQYYSAIDWSLPHQIQVQLQPDSGEPLSFTMEVGFYSVNEKRDLPDAFRFPDTTGMSAVDLVQANSSLQENPANMPLNPPLPVSDQASPAYSAPSAASQNPISQPVRTGVIGTPPVYRTASSQSLDSHWQKYLAR